MKKLKEIALDMNNELDHQAEALDELDVNVDKALDGLDNVNIKMKTLITKVNYLFITLLTLVHL